MSIIKAKDVPQNLGRDGRADSPGHSAKYGSHSVLDCDSNKVLDMQLVQVSSEHYIDFNCKIFTNNILFVIILQLKSLILLLLQSNEVQGSTHMEKEGLIWCVTYLQQSGFTISKIVTDRPKQIGKGIREELPSMKMNMMSGMKPDTLAKKKGLFFGLCMEKKPNKPFVLMQIIKRRQWKHPGGQNGTQLSTTFRINTATRTNSFQDASMVD